MPKRAIWSSARHWETIDRNGLAHEGTAGGARYHVDPYCGIDEEDARQIACDADLTEFVENQDLKEVRSNQPAWTGGCRCSMVGTTA